MLHVYYMYITCMLHVCYMYITCILHVCILHVYYMYITCILHVCYVTCILHVYYMYITCILHVYYMYITCILHVYYMYITCMLHVCYRRILPILLRYGTNLTGHECHIRIQCLTLWIHRVNVVNQIIYSNRVCIFMKTKGPQLLLAYHVYALLCIGDHVLRSVGYFLYTTCYIVYCFIRQLFYCFITLYYIM